jgi:hypothetical protein
VSFWSKGALHPGAVGFFNRLRSEDCVRKMSTQGLLLLKSSSPLVLQRHLRYLEIELMNTFWTLVCCSQHIIISYHLQKVGFAAPLAPEPNLWLGLPAPWRARTPQWNGTLETLETVNRVKPCLLWSFWLLRF